ncbi:MAG: RdgB/HAM1 family non-canonical purine NTP pyrophosphatase [Prevotellaceae bacterium]|jgi:XTP/dITP diphosphohydrolase|nr:RdgB/HAM1 family non-canonical purine NTP pyrophosphatase [Prevotellaceae bacterium]
MSIELAFATNNTHKLTEAAEILKDVATLRSLTDVECDAEIPETANTLHGNALLKAEYVFQRTGLPVFADDTGLEIEALGGAPGVYSARYAGENHDSAANIRKVLQRMQGATDRRAQFRTVIAYIPTDGQPAFFEGIVRGVITKEPRGEAGFGYDSIFIPDGYNLTFAEMDAATKNHISHRARALQAFLLEISHRMV